jgi:hypothetical protein
MAANRRWQPRRSPGCLDTRGSPVSRDSPRVLDSGAGIHENAIKPWKSWYFLRSRPNVPHFPGKVPGYAPENRFLSRLLSMAARMSRRAAPLLTGRDGHVADFAKDSVFLLFYVEPELTGNCFCAPRGLRAARVSENWFWGTLSLRSGWRGKCQAECTTWLHQPSTGTLRGPGLPAVRRAHRRRGHPMPGTRAARDANYVSHPICQMKPLLSGWLLCRPCVNTQETAFHNENNLCHSLSPCQCLGRSFVPLLVPLWGTAGAE